ncbi:sugar phosphate isomerase/epimerase family protein [Cohnella soli]|uniref:Sugar phosphate isomerase/epimerase family protein n=1 Tax=Cohnella soli TaxID=425005 RepID=A0ABW0HL64_9BACL
MALQHFERKNESIRNAFLELANKQPERLQKRLNFSWSNWGFGVEKLKQSARRLRAAGIEYIELHGNHHGPDTGYDADETRRILQEHGMKVSGVCGIFSPDNDLSSNRAIHRQAAIDYIRREVEFISAVGGSYLLVVPGAVGRPARNDDMEFHRSVDTLRRVADVFAEYGVKAAIEPIRSAEVSLVHTIAEAHAYIDAVDHPGVRHINADVFHMQTEETHIGEALLHAGERLLNVHLADSNRGALGEGSMDLDTIIMALYVMGFNQEGKYVTPEPLGPGGDPYPAMYGKPDAELLDSMVLKSVSYFRSREEELLSRILR